MEYDCWAVEEQQESGDGSDEGYEANVNLAPGMTVATPEGARFAKYTAAQAAPWMLFRMLLPLQKSLPPKPSS